MKDDRFPSLGQGLVVVVASLLTQYMVWAALHDMAGAWDMARNEQMALTMLLGNGLVLTVLMGAKGMSYGELFHPSRGSVWTTLLLVVPPVLLLVPASLLFNATLSDLMESLWPLSRWEEQAFEEMMEISLPSLVATCLLAPVLEEMLFRGVILRSFLLQYPRWPAMLCSAMVFGLAHMNIYQFVVAFLVGVLLAWLYERTRSLVPGIALHAAHNTGVVAMQLNQGSSELPLDADPLVWVGALCLAALGAWCLARLLQPSRGGQPAGETDRSVS
ncbi:MAG: CPBP family intramembrane metalloprotease [Hydrogenophaga sp.]|uniref:CPBP family intramembrane glutamic endopeptidase n=1 Tax=Hydrogenophaga sp. TaxID=1904254 RepID=UPI00272276EC|nr:CPBP family intramembrane glutamic endopeptidase [Hydrogenophaga sp.]MDO9480741.1 CPBP family intramembrane metalloprotease [Hydrogenophaga sp.]MDP3346671.1 CPBP family intramembrane metalloprotease [Hydrogenophaga sp.]MDP3808871.1 CPBP family intramembrane metalloprotease [Hydrogenophaga sp.]MDP3922001.1 CPBP family intramembrane metalloprotease [Hydrogenophaga sp.]